MDALAPGHIVVIVIVAFVLFFGWKQLPDMSRSLGRSLRIFKTEIKGMVADDEVRNALRDTVADTRTELAETTGSQLRAVLGQGPDRRRLTTP
jgi:sec-independent protein translocase protein TatA